MTKHRTKWSDEEIATLRRLTRDGMTYAQIGEQLGRTEHAVNVKAYHLNLSHPRVRVWTAAELAQAKRLYDAGNTVQEIGRILRRTHTAVSSTMTSHGLLDTSRQGCGKRKSDPQVYVLRKRGLMLREILLVLGRDDSENARKALRLWLEAYCARLASRFLRPARRGRSPTWRWSRPCVRRSHRSRGAPRCGSGRRGTRAEGRRWRRDPCACRGRSLVCSRPCGTRES